MTKPSAADQIRKKQRIKQVLADIVENLKDYFDEIQLKKFGQKSRFVVLNDITSIQKIGSKGLQLVTANFNSEQGSLTLAIAIKRFATPDEAITNKFLTNRLAAKLKDTGIFTPRVIFEHGTTLIYEGILGESFFDSKVDHNYKLILSGDALGRYHTPETRPVDPQRYIGLTKMVLKELQLQSDQRNIFVRRASDLLKGVLKYSSGTASFGDFHQGNILFSIDNDGSEDKVSTWLIDPEYTEEQKTSDRMEDIGTFFLHTVIDSFEQNGNLSSFRSELLPFFQGYDNFLSYYGLSLFDIYEGQHEEALSFHLGLNVLLEALFLQKKDLLQTQPIYDRWVLCLNLANYLWTTGMK